MDNGELLTRWTARLAMILFAAALLLGQTAANHRILQKLRRPIWTAGCLVYLLHVVGAFQFFHNWSHEHALSATARQTAEIVGLDWGGGLYVNYAFTLLWMADAVWWRLDCRGYDRRPRLVTGIVLGAMGFVAFNSTVVFGQGIARWIGVAACACLLASWVWHAVVARRQARLAAEQLQIPIR